MACALIQSYNAGDIYWKTLVFEMPSLSTNADLGMEYMSQLVWGRVCDYCEDLYAWSWFERMILAITQDEQLPEFIASRYVLDNGATKTMCAGCIQ